jgi:hypothetical protein
VSTIKCSKSRKPTLYIIGILLTTIAALLLVAAACSVVPKGAVDFPCEWYGPLPGAVEERITTDSRIAYCISRYPRGFSGGALSAYGATEKNSVVLQAPEAYPWENDLTLVREEDIILANDHALKPGETHLWSRWSQAVNPWLLLTARFAVWNKGSIDCAAEDIVYVGGAVDEGYLPSPVGPIILGIGIWLIKRGRKR